MLTELILFFLFSLFLAMVGLGGGAFYVPLLLAMHYPFALASSTSLFLISVTGFSAFSRYQKEKLVDWQLAIVMETFTSLGAFTGGFSAFKIHETYLKIGFAILLIYASYLMLRVELKGREKIILKTGFGYWVRHFDHYSYSVFLPAILPITFAIGFFSGVLGVAGGMLKVPIMILYFGIPAKIAIATSSLMVGFTGLMGFSGHLFTGKVNWLLCVSLGLVVLLGSQLGAKISLTLPARKLKLTLAVILVIIAIWMIIKAY